MKTFGWIVAVIVATLIAALIAFGVYAKGFYDNIKFDFKLDKSKINLKDILVQLLVSKSVAIPVQLIVDNNNKQGLQLKDVFIKINYLGKDVLQTNKDSASLKVVNIPANTIGYTINDFVQIFANSSSVQLVNELIKGNKPEVEITVSGKIFNIPREFTFKQNLEF